ncbi:putative ABC transport system permease protein [Neorhizobium galegae]|uniref:ABC transporter permease n=1 Tax=Neorhizobium galegae TaxID=399 RepID=UPI001AE9A46F|nr:FtsX-like permease family protein [Neorhizobium galegae]MBP2547669.1 putative ABC transport system permease protein [Neorhizobium galegae]
MLFQQTRVMIHASLASLPRRFALSASMALSVALVVMTLAGFLAMAKGFEVALAGAGSPRVAVILGGGTNQESGSAIPPGALHALSALSGDPGLARNTAGDLLLSREIVVPVDVADVKSGASRTLALRGMDATGAAIRDTVTLTQGLMFSGGRRDIVIGAKIARALGLYVGDVLRLGPVDWTVSGEFSAGGSAFESEIWADLEAVRAAFDRQGEVQSVKLRLNDPMALERLQQYLAGVAETPLVAVSEADLYAGQSARTASLIRLFGWPLAGLMAFGASAGALNTMMSSVSERAVEIATVRALGFSRLAAFIATGVEAMVLALVGTVLGIGLSLIAFNGWQASTIGANNARMAFDLAVTPDVMLSAGLIGLVIGLVGGALPALAATRQPLAAALGGRG